jgi:type VI secretion system protein ImpE
MSVTEALKQGHLVRARKLQKATAEASGHAQDQLLLAELAVVAGKLNTAKRLFESIESDDPTWTDSLADFLAILQAEKRRRKLKRSRTEFTTELPVHAQSRIRTSQELLMGRGQSALKWCENAEEHSPELQGHVDGREFSGLRDLDDRFGNILELFLGSRYVIAPMERFNRIRFLPVLGHVDAVYRPVELRLLSGVIVPARMPLIYPGTHEAKGYLSLGLDTELCSDENGPVTGLGARTWWIGEDEIPLKECRQIDIQVVSYESR